MQRLKSIGQRGSRPREGAWTVHINDPQRNAPHKFSRNKISTTKYNILTFLPKNLFEQFHRLANVYFLFIVILNWIPQLQAFGREVAMIPIIVVLSVTAIKDLFEDRRRAWADNQVNYSVCNVLSINGQYEPKQWRKVEVGDIIKLKADDIIPADLLLLHTSSPDGVCFVETANIDGETNLKQRRMFYERDGDFDPARLRSAPVVCEAPNNRIYEFNAHVEVGGQSYPLDAGSMLLRGCVVRNTETVIGVVVYAGHDTKAMLNNTGPRSKRSKLERQMNRHILYCCLILLALCFAGGLGSGVWMSKRDYKNVPYLPYESSDPEPPMEGFLRFWTYFIILQTMVPISLYISIELVKLAQIFFIQEDLDLYHEESDTKMKCRALNITEDLGQIEYIFSDKTGTLTQNKMVFHRCSVNGACYTHSQPEHGRACQDAFTFPRDQQLVQALATDRGEVGRDESSFLHLFMLAMAACNTVAATPSGQETPIPESNADWRRQGEDWVHVRSGRVLRQQPTSAPGVGRVKFESESPDESALVAAAQVYGYTLLSRAKDWVTVHCKGETLRYSQLAVLPFDSTRKRASVILRCPDGTILLLTKGADACVYECLAREPFADARSETQGHIDEFARGGLRTLSFAFRVLSEEEYEDWAHKHKQAAMALVNRAELLMASHNAIETNLTLLGATGIEDKLQEGVPEAIARLREAGLKIWVLTGDKQETAIEIAFTCHLLTRHMRQMIINSNAAAKPFDKRDPKEKALHDAAAEAEVNVMLDNFAASISADEERALIVDGASLVQCLRPQLRQKFLTLACSCKVVVCCRSTPLQKAQVVHLVKEACKVMTLAIGDGANDVSMLQMADVGVGISGQEGMQAVMASDFAIAQFRFLSKLMLVHGHWSYDRIARMILYFYYKNTVNVFILFWYMFYCGFSAQNAIDQLYLMMYNLLFTSLPVMITAIFDQDASQPLLTLNPILYEIGQKDLSYRNKFGFFVLDGLWQSLVIHFVNYWAFAYSEFTDISVFGTATFTSLVLATSIQMGIETRHWVWLNYFFLAFSVVLYFSFALVYNSICCGFPGLVPSSYWVIQKCFGNGMYWFAAIILAPLAAVGPGLLIRLYKVYFHPTAVEYAREAGVLRSRAQRSHARGKWWWEKVLDRIVPHSTAPNRRHSAKHKSPELASNLNNSMHAQIITAPDSISMSQLDGTNESEVTTT